jgi:hypothetical protein
MRRALLPLLLASLCAPAAAQAATPTEPVDLTQVTAQKQVVDEIVPRRTRARAAGARTEQFTDAQGRAFRISTDIPDVDLKPFANVLAAVAHGDEITRVRVEAVKLEQMGAVCGNPQAVACYAPDDPQRSFDGQLWFGVDDPDVVHTLVHEYGHHVDNQLLNLGHLGGACTFGNDGSRNWFFERQLEDAFLQSGISCRPDADWEHLLGEVFAEDFAQLNGIQGWVLRSVRPPTQTQLGAMAFDMRERYRPSRRRWSAAVRPGGQRTRRFSLRNWTVLDLRTSSRFALRVVRRGSTPRTVGRRGRRVFQLVPPGKYEVRVSGRGGTGGRARVTLDYL